MRTLIRFLVRVRNFVTNRGNDERLQEEIEQHIALQTEDNIQAGIPATEARRQARLKFGGIETVREHYLAEQSLPFLEMLLQDTLFALRTMRKSWS